MFMAACSLGKCPRCRTALRNLALRISTALVVLTKRLVGEFDLSSDGSIFQMARWVFLGATRTRDYSRLKNYPAVTAAFLAGEGGRCRS